MYKKNIVVMAMLLLGMIIVINAEQTRVQSVVSATNIIQSPKRPENLQKPNSANFLQAQKMLKQERHEKFEEIKRRIINHEFKKPEKKIVNKPSKIRAKYEALKQRIEKGMLGKDDGQKLNDNDLKLNVIGDQKLSKEKLAQVIQNTTKDKSKFYTYIYTCLVDGDYCYIAGESYPNGWVIILNISDTSNIFRVGQVPTQIEFILSLAKSGNFLYAVGGRWNLGRMKVINVSNPASPLIVGSLDFPDTIPLDIEIQDNYAYIAEDEGFRVVDISNPSTLSTVGYIPDMYCSCLTVDNNFAYVGGAEFVVIDISEPTNPIRRGSIEDVECIDVRVKGNYAYLTEGVGGLSIIDISNPDAPALIFYPDDTYWLSCVTDGDYSYAAGIIYPWSEEFGVISVFDVTDVNNIKVLAQVGLGEIEWVPSITKSGDYLYAVGIGSAGGTLWIIDVSVPLEPEIVSTTTFGDEIWDIHVQADKAYLACDDELRIIDISNPSSPSQIGALPISECYSVFASGNFAYIIDGFHSFVVVDVSNPASPYCRGEIWFEEGDMFDVAVQGNYAYACGEGLYVVDITNPDAPDTVAYNGDVEGFTIEISNNYAYLAGDGLYIVDISSPTDPVFAASFGDCLSEDSDAISVQGTYVYNSAWEEFRVIDCSNFGPPLLSRIGKWWVEAVFIDQVEDTFAYCGTTWINPGLYIINTANYITPDTISHFPTDDFVYDVYVVDNLAYLANGDQGLRILNVEDRENPIEVGCFDTPGSARGVFVLGSYAYVADYDCGLRIINISNPSNPSEVGYWDTYGNALKVYVVDSPITTYAYVADDWYGLRIIDVTSPSNPIEIGYCYVGAVSDVLVRNNIAYVASYGWSSGLHIIDVDNPVAPIEIGYYQIPIYWYWDYFTPKVFIKDNLVYFACRTGTTIIDVSIPSNPSRVGSISTRSFDVWVKGNNCYIASTGLKIFDVSDPTGGIYIVGRYRAEEEIYLVTLEICGEYVYACGEGLYVYDIETYPTVPFLVAQFEDCYSEWFDAISVQDGLVYNALEEEMIVIDCNDLDNIFICGRYELEQLEGSISGIKFLDANGNGIMDGNDYGLPNWTIRLDPGPIFTRTNYYGEYYFDDLPANTYTVSEVMKPYWQQTCPSSGTYNVVLDIGQNISDCNFGNRPTASIQDLSVGIGGGVARPGFNKIYSITYENKGTIDVNNVVVVCTLPSQVMFFDCSYGGIYSGTGYGGTVTWNLGTVLLGTINWLWVEVNIPSSLELGTQLRSAVNIEPLTGDVNTDDNYDDEIEVVVGAYDPNDKQVTPEGYIKATDELEYLIRFQNVGTWYAQNVVVRDTLDPDLDTLSVVPVATSHPYTSFGRNGRVLIWTFNDIYLPDSTTNEPGSHGFVKFRVKPLATSMPGTRIDNRGAITFDYNPPIITNTVTNYIPLPGWAKKESIPAQVKDGGALTAGPSDKATTLYCFTGMKTNSFYRYTEGSGWTKVESLPFGQKYPDTTKTNTKFIGKGSALCFDGDHTIYATRGNGTHQLWSFDINSNTWTKEKYLPSAKGAKGGTSLFFKDTLLYVLVGGQKPTDNNFFAYNPARKTWRTLQKAPVGNNNKPWKDGSAIIAIGETIFGLKGGDKYNALWAYNITTNSWTEIESCPQVHPDLRKRNKVKDGAAMCTDGVVAYMIKGGGKQDFWKYSRSDKGAWTPLCTIPKYSPEPNKSVPKTGAALAYTDGRVWLIKGNKRNEFLQFTPTKELSVPTASLTNVVITNDKSLETLVFSFNAKPNPFTKLTTIQYTVPVAGKVTIKLYNSAGRLIETLVDEHLNAGSYTTKLSSKSLASGIYFLKYQDAMNSSEVKLIVQ